MVTFGEKASRKMFFSCIICGKGMERVQYNSQGRTQDSRYPTPRSAFHRPRVKTAWAGEDYLYPIFSKSRAFKDFKNDKDLTSCDDKYKVKFSGVNIFWGEYFLRINIFQGHLVFRDEYFPRGYIVQGCLFGWGEYFTGVNIFQGGTFWW